MHGTEGFEGKLQRLTGFINLDGLWPEPFRRCFLAKSWPFELVKLLDIRQFGQFGRLRFEAR